MTENNKTLAWQYYEQGRAYNNRLVPNQYQLVNTNIEFFSGNQWIHMRETPAMRKLARPTFNIIKRVVSLFVASITSSAVTVNFEPLAYYDGENLKDRSVNAAACATAEVRNLFDKFKMDYRAREALFDGAQTGDYCAHFYWDPDALPYGGAFGAHRGEIQFELVDGINVMFGNPNTPDVQSQPYILVIGRDTVDNLKWEAERYRKNKQKYGKSGTASDDRDIDSIQFDNEYQWQAAVGGKTELIASDDNNGKCLYVYMYTKVTKEEEVIDPKTGLTMMEDALDKNGKPIPLKTKGKPILTSDGKPMYKQVPVKRMVTSVHVTKATKNCNIFEDVDTGLSLYPIAWGNWEKQKNQYHGRALVTGIVPNQIFINSMMAMVFRHLQLQSFSKTLYNADLISQWNNELGVAIGVSGMQPGQDLRSVAMNLQPADMSNQIMLAIDRALQYTRECLGATDAQMGKVRPDNTSALMVLQSSAEVPLENTRAGLHEWYEDMAAILLDMMGTYYGERPIVKNREMQEVVNNPSGAPVIDPNTGLMMTTVTTKRVLENFDFSTLKHLWLNIAYGMKSFTEQKPKTETQEAKTEAKKPKTETQKPKKTEQKPKTEAKKPKTEAKKTAPEKSERDKAVAVAFAPKAKTTETKAKATENATGLTFNNKVGNWVNNLANADSIRVARPNANRNTYQVVAFTKGKTYAYDDVSPSMLKKAFGKDKAAEIVSTAAEKAGELASFDIEHAPVVDPKAAAAERAKKRAEAKAARERDTYGRLVSKGMMSFMANSKARTGDSTDGALVPVYRVAEPGAVHNAKLIGGISIWTDKPAVANTWRGMKGAEAYGQTGKRIGPKGHRTTIDAAMTQLAELDPKSKEAAQYRALIAASEQKLREYTNGVTRLDPWREAFSTPHDEDIVNGAALYECYLNLTNPLVVDAGGKGMAYVQEIADQIQDSEYDGAIIHNVNGIITDTNLGGGELDLSTVYITTKAGQGKSTLNTNPTDDALMQYSDDEFITAEIEAEATEDLMRERIERLIDADDLYKLRVEYSNLMSADDFEFNHSVDTLVEDLFSDDMLLEDVSYLLYEDANYADDLSYEEFVAEIVEPFKRFLQLDRQFSEQETARRLYKAVSLIDVPGLRSKLLDAVGKLQADKNGRVKVNAGTINRINNAGGGVPAYEMNLAMVKQFLEGRDSFTVDEFLQWYAEHNANLDILELTGDDARWKKYQMKSLGESDDYTERLYVLPRFMGYDNYDMSVHWGRYYDPAVDVIRDVAVHTRYNRRADPETGEVRLFIEEVQSDWDNARSKETKGPMAPMDSSKYPAFVLRQLIKEAVDNGVGVAWTDANTQATRWSPEFLGAYQNVYDKVMVKEAKKYGDVSHRIVTEARGLGVFYPQYIPYLKKMFSENYDDKQMEQASIAMATAVGKTKNSAPENRIDDSVREFQSFSESLNENQVFNLTRHLANNPETLRNLYSLIQEVDGKEGYWVLELNEKGYNQFKNGEVYAYSDDEFVEYDFSDDEAPKNNYADGTLESSILNVLRKADNPEEASAALAEYVSNLLNTGEIPIVDAKTAAQERAASVFQPKISREEHAVIRDQLDDLIEQYGAIPKGYKPQRDVSIPKSTDGETFVRNFVRTAIESNGVTDASVELLERGVLQDQMLSHSVATDKAAIANADRTIRKLGFQRALNEWRGRADGERAMTKNDVVLGECLMIAANKAGDLETGYQLAAELAEAGTNAGQVTQAFSILKKAPPAWQLYYINRVINRMNTKYAKRINSGKMTQIVINRDLAKAVLRSKTQEDITNAMDALLDDIASQIPATYMDKWNAWRYLAMLGNPRTHIRNIVGNAIFTPAKFAKDMIAAGLESGFEKAGFEFTRSKTTRPVSAERKAFAEADFEGIKDELQSGGKYNPENVIEQHRTIFGIPLLEMARKKNGDYLEAEDLIFLKRHYVNALGKYLEANDADINWIRTTKDGARLLNAARQYAVLEAQKATYRDASRVASALNSLKSVPGLGVLMEGAMPFTKTPTNILKRGIEYSPVGLIKTIATETGKLKTGEITANTYCDNLAAGMTGTGIMFLGALLTSMGLLRGGPDDDDNKAEFEKLQGYQDYSITVGNQNFTIDWACPVAMPLFVGAELYKAFDEGDGLSNGDWMNLATVIAEPMTQLSMLSGLNDALSSAKYDKNPLSSVAVTLGTGYISQAFPTFLAQLSRTAVEDRRTTYVDKNSDVPAALQRWFQTNVMGKTPANVARAKYIDAWGRYDTDASLIVRAFDNMIAPWYRNTITTDPLEAELTRLSESVGTGVLVTAPERYFSWSNNRIDLTAEQYSDLALTRGQTLHSALDSLLNSEAYSAMTDEQRATAVENIKNYATYAGRKEVISEYQADTYNWIDKCDGDPNRIENMAIMRSVAKSLGVDADNNSKFYDLVIDADWMTPQEQGQILSQTYVTTSKTFKYGGKTYDLTPEVKAALYQEFRNEFPLYYAELASTQKWQTAGSDKKLDLLADLRSDVAANCRKVIGAQLSNGTLGTPGSIGAFSYTDTLENSSNSTSAGTLGKFPW